MNIRTSIRKATLNAALFMNQTNTGCIVFHCSNVNTTQWKSLKRIVFKHFNVTQLQKKKNHTLKFVYQPTFSLVFQSNSGLLFPFVFQNKPKLEQQRTATKQLQPLLVQAKKTSYKQKLNTKKLNDIGEPEPKFSFTGGPLCVLFYSLPSKTTDNTNTLNLLFKQIQASQSIVDHHLVLLYLKLDQTYINHIDFKYWLDLRPEHVFKESLLCLSQPMITLCELHHLMVFYFFVYCEALQ